MPFKQYPTEQLLVILRNYNNANDPAKRISTKHLSDFMSKTTTLLVYRTFLKHFLDVRHCTTAT